MWSANQTCKICTSNKLEIGQRRKEKCKEKKINKNYPNNAKFVTKNLIILSKIQNALNVIIFFATLAYHNTSSHNLPIDKHK